MNSINKSFLDFTYELEVMIKVKRPSFTPTPKDGVCVCTLLSFFTQKKYTMGNTSQVLYGQAFLCNTLHYVLSLVGYII